MNASVQLTQASEADCFDGSTPDRLQDFDIRIEVTEQPVLLQVSHEHHSSPSWHCSDYDF